MQTTLLSSKGQVIIPKTLRTAKHWSVGTRLEVRDTPEGILLKHIAPAQKTDLKPGLAAIRQRIAYSGEVLSLADMDNVIMREAAHKSQHDPRK